MRPVLQAVLVVVSLAVWDHSIVEVVRDCIDVEQQREVWKNEEFCAENVPVIQAVLAMLAAPEPPEAREGSRFSGKDLEYLSEDEAEDQAIEYQRKQTVSEPHEEVLPSSSPESTQDFLQLGHKTSKRRFKRELRDGDAIYTTQDNKLWPNGIVYYHMQPDDGNIQVVNGRNWIGLGNVAAQRVGVAISEIESKTCVQFEHIANVAGWAARSYIHMGRVEPASRSCFSNSGTGGPGRNLLGPSVINLVEPDDDADAFPGGCPSGTVMHEFGHALGFGHTQQRNDRDLYFEVTGTFKKDHQYIKGMRVALPFQKNRTFAHTAQQNIGQPFNSTKDVCMTACRLQGQEDSRCVAAHWYRFHGDRGTCQLKNNLHGQVVPSGNIRDEVMLMGKENADPPLLKKTNDKYEILQELATSIMYYQANKRENHLGVVSVYRFNPHMIASEASKSQITQTQYDTLTNQAKQRRRLSESDIAAWNLLYGCQGLKVFYGFNHTSHTTDSETTVTMNPGQNLGHLKKQLKLLLQRANFELYTLRGKGQLGNLGQKVTSPDTTPLINLDLHGGRAIRVKYPRTAADDACPRSIVRRVAPTTVCPPVGYVQGFEVGTTANCELHHNRCRTRVV